MRLRRCIIGPAMATTVEIFLHIGAGQPHGKLVCMCANMPPLAVAVAVSPPFARLPTRAAEAGASPHMICLPLGGGLSGPPHGVWCAHTGAAPPRLPEAPVGQPPPLRAGQMLCLGLCGVGLPGLLGLLGLLGFLGFLWLLGLLGLLWLVLQLGFSSKHGGLKAKTFVLNRV